VTSWDDLLHPHPTTSNHPHLGVVGNGTTDSYGASALAAECEVVRQATEGSRNDALNRAWFRMARIIAVGRLDEEEARTALWAAGLACGLPEREVGVVLRQGTGSALQAGQALPRTIDALDPPPELTPLAAAATPPHQDHDLEVSAPTSSWALADLNAALDGSYTTPHPQFLTRSDGACLLYAGKVNGLLGESESGKSWVAMLAVRQALQAGQRVLYVDFEDALPTFVSRLRALGATTGDLGGGLLGYINPADAFDVLARQALAEALEDVKPDLIVLDGVNAAMTLMGLELTDNTDATRFHQALLRPLAATGAAVLTVDHVTKNRETRGKGGIGAQAKRALVDGCALAVEVLEPFGAGSTGRLRVTVDKDRPGAVRGLAQAGQLVGFAVLHSHDGVVDLVLEAPDHEKAVQANSDPQRLTLVMERVSTLLRDLGSTGISGTGIEKAVAARAARVREAVEALVDGGWVRRSPRQGRGGGFVYLHVRPYSEAQPDTDEDLEL